MRDYEPTAEPLPCERDPDMWFPDGQTREALLLAELAIMRCRACPALRACAELAASVRPRPTHGVWAGKNYNQEQVAG